MDKLSTPENMVITSVCNEGDGYTVFSTREITLSGDRWRLLSEQQSCTNFRLRYSNSDYSADFHVAGDPTLLVILSGTVRITLRSGEYKDFSAGELFIAEDYLLPYITFNTEMHGHQAKVVGDEPLRVLHLKLEKRSHLVSLP